MQNYFYRDKEGREIGPFDLATLTKFRAAGVLDVDTPVRTADSAEWKPCRELIANTSAAPSTPPQGAEPPSGKSGVAQPKWIIGLIILAATIFFVTKKEEVGTGGAPPPSSSLAERSMSLLNEQGHNLRQQNLGLINKLARKGLRIGMEYQNSNPFIIQQGGAPLFSSAIYIFSKQGVSVYYTVSGNGNILRRLSDGALITGDDSSVRGWNNAVGGFRKGETLVKGNDPTPIDKVIYGPGDRMPVLENAAYRDEGTSVYVDWSQAHSLYFVLSGANSGSEVWTIKNDGLVLESATTPGYTLTLSMSTTGESASARKEDFGGYTSRKGQDEGHNMAVCINNLRLIDSAKQQWALEQRKRTTDMPTMDDLRPYLGRGLDGAFPVCPDGGVYTLRSVGEPPTCTTPGHLLP